jgi:ADP-ribose pyrophosphatase
MAKKATAPKPLASPPKPSKAKLSRKKGLKSRAKPIILGSGESARVLNSEVVYNGPLFRVVQDRIVEPSGKHAVRDVIRHNGSAVILAIDNSKSKKDPWIVMERQYRHAASRFLWELPAGKLEQGEDPLEGAQRELEEETGYRAKKWRPLVEYFASPGFLGESMNVFLAEGLIAGEARPEEDEEIEIRLVKLSEVLTAIKTGGIMDGKTLSAVLFYAHSFARKRGK